MSHTIESEQIEHRHIQNKMLIIAKKLLASKKQLQEEIRNDAKKPEFQAAIAELRRIRKS